MRRREGVVGATTIHECRVQETVCKPTQILWAEAQVAEGGKDSAVVAAASASAVIAVDASIPLVAAVA